MAVKKIKYSETYADDVYEYRHVQLPPRLEDRLPKGRLLAEDEWLAMGVHVASGWEHYLIHRPEPHVLLFRRPLAAALGNAPNELNRKTGSSCSLVELVQAAAVVEGVDRSSPAVVQVARRVLRRRAAGGEGPSGTAAAAASVQQRLQPARRGKPAPLRQVALAPPPAAAASARQLRSLQRARARAAMEGWGGAREDERKAAGGGGGGQALSGGRGRGRRSTREGQGESNFGNPS
eukprot:jgi/Mesen1/5864/ME000298S05134